MATAERISTAGIVKRVGEDGVFESDHVQPVYAFKILVGALFAVEQLHHAHARDVFLGEAVDAGNGGYGRGDSSPGRGSRIGG